MMKSTRCISCGKEFQYKTILPGDPLYMDTTGNVVRCTKEVAPCVCQKCERGCRKKDGRP